MEIPSSISGVRIRITEERWLHISQRHPELSAFREKILQTIASPDMIQRGDFGTLMAIKRLQENYLVVVYREVSTEDGFVVTAYLAEKVRGREMIWKR